MTLLENNFAGKMIKFFQWPEITANRKGICKQSKSIELDYESWAETQQNCIECSAFSHNQDRDSCRNLVFFCYDMIWRLVFFYFLQDWTDLIDCTICWLNFSSQLHFSSFFRQFFFSSSWTKNHVTFQFTIMRKQVRTQISKYFTKSCCMLYIRCDV